MNTAYNYYLDNCILIPHQFEGLKSMFMIGSTTVFYHQKCKLELSYASMFHRLRFILFAPFIPNGLSHFYQLNESISSLHGLR